VKPRSARMFLGIALLLYFLWVALLATMAVLTATLPADREPKKSAVSRADQIEVGRARGKIETGDGRAAFRVKCA
jgi:hypothetical protein